MNSFLLIFIEFFIEFRIFWYIICWGCKQIGGLRAKKWFFCCSLIDLVIFFNFYPLKNHQFTSNFDKFGVVEKVIYLSIQKKMQQKFSMSFFVLKYAIVWFRRVLKKHKIGSNFSETPRGAKKRYLGRCVMTKYIRKTSLDFNSFTTPEQSLQKTEISKFYFLPFLIITSKTINLHLKPYKLYINRKLIVSAI